MSSQNVIRPGRRFISSKFKEFCRCSNIDHTKTTTYDPQCNGVVERTNKTIAEVWDLQKVAQLKFFATGGL